MTFTPLTARTKNRLCEHDLEVVRSGIFQGQQAILTGCADPDCRWKLPRTCWGTELAH